MRSRALAGPLGATATIVACIAGVQVLGPRAAGFPLLLGLLGFGAWRVARVACRPAALADAVLLAWTFGVAWVVLVAEALSAFGALGRPLGWLLGCGALAVVAAWLPRSSRSLWPADPLAGWRELAWPAHLLVLAVGLHLAVLAVLTPFAGINVSDSVAAYLPRSVRYLQDGTFAAYSTHYDYLQYLHQTLVAIQLLFLRTDALVVPTSFAIALLTSLAAFTFARSLGWRAPLPLATALLPWTMPAFLLHATVPNFDVLTGLWLLLALYFLRRGHAATSPRWLLPAAIATGLALATKPTFWFAAPGLGLVWVWVFARPLRRRARPGRRQRADPTVGDVRRPGALTVSGGPCGAVRVRSRSVPRVGVLALACAIVVAVLGLPFLARNILTRGYLLGPPNMQVQMSGADMGFRDRLDLLAFNGLALGHQLLAPPSLLSVETAAGLDQSFRTRAEALGLRVPDARLTVHHDWRDLIRHAHPVHRYDSNHASFGAAFLLVMVPALLALPFARRRLGPRWPFSLMMAWVGLCYFAVYMLVYRYHVASIRFLIEMVIVLLPIAPAALALLPSRALGPALVALALPLVLELNGTVRLNRWLPPDAVVMTPRAEQIYRFSGGDASASDAARALDRRYPPSFEPDVWIHDDGTGHPSFPDYTFLGPSLERRTHYWAPSRAPGPPPGPALTSDRALADDLARSGAVVADRLSPGIWLLLPNDRLRVRVAVVQSAISGEPVARVEATVPPGRYRAPTFAAFTSDGGARPSWRPFDQPGPTGAWDVPIDAAMRGGVRVEVRDGNERRVAERTDVAGARFGGP